MVFIIMQYPVEIDPLFVFISNQLRWDLRWNSRGTKNQIPQSSLWSGIIVIRFHKGEIPIIRLNESLGSFNCFVWRVNKVNHADSGFAYPVIKIQRYITVRKCPDVRKKSIFTKLYIDLRKLLKGWSSVTDDNETGV